PLIEGTVVENRGALFEVMVDGHVVRCLLRGKLKKGKQRAATPVAAGDRVKIAMLEPGRGVIEEVLPRESDLSRTAAGSVPLQQTLVANVDQAVIVFAAAEPRPDLFLLDRFLVQAMAGGLEPLVCINKTDLVDGEPPRRAACGQARLSAGGQVHARFAVYRKCGFRVLFTSAEAGDGVPELKEALTDRRSVLCGPSGVGKSSLLNALSPGLALRVGDMGDVTHKGRHTTSSITLLELPFGGWVADTAGLRQMRFWDVSADQVAAAFPDVAPFIGGCRFSNCSHGGEDGCAIREAVERGELEERRVRSWIQMAVGQRKERE
ncbi:MAG: ribosome small subunit-dependent GTPase A, partial [Armatimonadetes bacterium]|nr:ribosome small subunit-dependent GTPase A [Armatimonadota bacterium]